MVIRQGCVMGGQILGHTARRTGGLDHRWLLPGQTHLAKKLKLEQFPPFFF